MPLGDAVPERLFPIFRDRDELSSSHDLNEVIREALTHSRSLIVVCSPRAASSLWVNKEIIEFKRLGRTASIRCLIVEGEPNASDKPEKYPAGAECFPAAVRFELGEDGQLSTRRAEVVAADARETGDGKRNALLKLIAGALGVEYDALRRRDDEYRRSQLKRTRFALAGVAGLAALAMAASIFAWKQRAAAIDFAQRALRTRKEADKLVAYMVTNLRDKLKRIQRLDLLSDVNDRVTAFYTTFGAEEGDWELVRNQTLALDCNGDVKVEAGEFDSALALYAAALAQRQKLASLTGAPGEFRRDLVVSHRKLAEAQRGKRDFDAALREYRSAIDLAHRLIADEPTIAKWRGDLALVLSGLGDMTLRLEKVEATLEAWNEEYAALTEAARLEPRSVEWTQCLAENRHNVAAVLLVRGERSAAFEAWRQSFEHWRTRVSLEVSGELIEELDQVAREFAGLIQDDPPQPGMREALAAAMTVQAALEHSTRSEAATDEPWLALVQRAASLVEK